MKNILIVLFLLITINGLAQVRSNGRRGQKKDSLTVLSCPLAESFEPPPPKEKTYGYEKQEGSITLVSQSDTIVKSCIDATVSRIQKDEEGKWEIVLFHNDYWFWYSGITKLAVRKDQKVKSGEALGYNLPGQPIELLVYDFETPVDAKKYLDCKR